MLTGLRWKRIILDFRNFLGYGQCVQIGRRISWRIILIRSRKVEAGVTGQTQHNLSQLILASTGGERKCFDLLTILVTGLEVHPGIDPGWIFPQSSFQPAYRFKEIAPVLFGDRSQTEDDVCDTIGV